MGGKEGDGRGVVIVLNGECNACMHAGGMGVKGGLER